MILLKYIVGRAFAIQNATANPTAALLSYGL
jgi:hypothetical protein